MTIEYKGKTYYVTDTPTPRDFMKVSSAKMDICDGDISIFHDSTNLSAIYTALSIKTFSFIYAFCPELLIDLKVLPEKPNIGSTSAKVAYESCSMEVLSELISLGKDVISGIEAIYIGYFENQKKTGERQDMK